MRGRWRTKMRRRVCESFVLLTVVSCLWMVENGKGSPLILSAAANVAKDHPSWRHSFATPDWTLYHKSEEMMERIRALGETCNVLEVENLAMRNVAVGDRDALAEDGIRTTLYARLTSSKNDLALARYWKSKLSIMLVSGEHGRELISSEIALRLIEIACGEYEDQSGSPKMTKVVQKIRMKLLAELSRTEITIVPIASLSSRLMVENGSLCERLNGRQVDVNRNWDFHFGESDRDTLPDEEQPGPFPFSEPEAQALRTVAETVQPMVYVSFHSGDSAIVIPWDYDAKPPTGADGERLRYVAERVAASHCQTCAIGNSRKLFGYSAYGTAVDYLHGRLRVPFTYTMEVFGDLKTQKNDCFRAYNPVEIDAYNSVVNNWVAAVATLSESVHDRLHLERQGGTNFLNISTEEEESADVVRNLHDHRRGLTVDPPAIDAAEITLACACLAMFCGMILFVRTKIFIDRRALKASKWK